MSPAPHHVGAAAWGAWIKPHSTGAHRNPIYEGLGVLRGEPNGAHANVTFLARQRPLI